MDGCPGHAQGRAIPPALRDVAGFLVHQLAFRLREHTDQAIAADDLRPRQVGIVLLLREEGALSQQQLGEQLGMDRTTTMQLVTALERQDVVMREDDPSDRRAWRVTLTAAGRRLAGRLTERVAQAEREVLGRLSPAEQSELKALLRKALSGGA